MMAFHRRLVAFLIFLAMTALGSGAALANPMSLFKGPVISDTELAAARGGFSLPGGIEIDFAVAMTTSVNGTQILNTQFVLAGDDIFSGVSMGNEVAASVLPVTGSAIESTQVLGQAADKTTAESLAAGAPPPNVGVELPQTALVPNVPKAEGTMAMSVGSSTMSADPAQAAASNIPSDVMSVRAEMEGLVVEHSIGQRISSLIINTVDSRVIDHQVDVNIAIRNVQPMTLGSLPFRVQRLAFDAMSWRGS